MSTAPANTVLHGMTVLELGAGSHPAQVAGMLLADNGARVVKVEPPTGDRLRDALPSGFLVWNRGKESLVADLRTPEGRDEVWGWARAADVLIEGFAPGRLAEWNLDPASLRAENPRLVTASVSGFGPRGAYSGIKGYEGVVSAKAGFFSRGDFGFRDGPIFSGVPLAGAGASHMLFSGVLAALVAARRPDGASTSTRRSCRASPPPTTSSPRTSSSRSAPGRAGRPRTPPPAPAASSPPADTRWCSARATASGW